MRPRSPSSSLSPALIVPEKNLVAVFINATDSNQEATPPRLTSKSRHTESHGHLATIGSLSRIDGVKVAALCHGDTPDNTGTTLPGR
jgi:hypothetical protein